VVITGPTRNRLSWEAGTVGSNPTLSAKICEANFGEISPSAEGGEVDPLACGL
jgi:hypothetical protein